MSDEFLGTHHAAQTETPDCPDGEPRWALVEPKSKAGIRVVEIPQPMLPLVAAHLETLNGIHNSHELVFPSEAGTPIDPKNIRRRHFAPAMKALGISGVRQHDMRRTFIALHVEAGTHPKLVQDRVGHSDISLTMNVYGKLAGKMKLGAAEQARFNGLAHDALPANASREATPADGPQSNRRLRLQWRKPMRALNAGEPEENLASKTDAGDFAEGGKEK